jgi:predicted nuclease with RNAse H fold
MVTPVFSITLKQSTTSHAVLIETQYNMLSNWIREEPLNTTVASVSDNVCIITSMLAALMACVGLKCSVRPGDRQMYYINHW